MKKSLQHIQNLIFDLGGVILNIDPGKSVESMKKLGIDHFDQLYSQFKQNETFDKLEKGLISEDAFIDEILGHQNQPIERESVIQAWNSLLLDFPKERIQVLEHFRDSKEHRTFLLSNTNAIHKRAYTQDLEAQFGYKGLEELFEKAYFSHEINMRKPDFEIFQFVLEDSLLNPSETLFIDDSEANIRAAEQLGIQTYLIQDGTSIVDLM